MIWTDRYIKDVSKTSMVVSDGDDGSRIVMCMFRRFGGEFSKFGTIKRFYAHGPAGVVDWGDDFDKVKAEYERLRASAQ